MLYHNGTKWVNKERISLGISEATFELEEEETERKYPVGVFNVTMFDKIG